MSRKLTIDFVLNKTNTNNPKNIRVLHLWKNNISDISILSEFPSLETISLSTNQIKDISVFKKIKNVRELYLKDNQINDFNQIENLKNCKKLEKLTLKDNPIANSSNYIQKVLEMLPQLKKLDDIDVKKLKINNNNFNSPLANKDKNNNYNIQSPDNSKNDLSIKSGSESMSSERRGEAKNDSAAPDPQASLFSENLNINEHNENSNNINNGMNIINSHKILNFKSNDNHQKDKSDLLNRSFRKKITEGSFRKVVKNKNNLNNNNNNNNNNNDQEEKKKQLLERSINDNKVRNEKLLSQTQSSGFYKNPFKNNNDLGGKEKGGYKKKIIGNFKQEQEHKENNKKKQNVINSVFKKYQFFDNDKENKKEEEIKKSNYSPNSIFQKINKLKPLMTSSKVLGSSNKKNINEINSNSINEFDKNKTNVIKNGKEENVNQSVVESIKLLMCTLSVEGLKTIQNDVQKIIEEKNKK